MTPREFRAKIAARIKLKGLRAYAREVEIDPKGLNLIAAGEREPNDETVAKLGFRRTVDYQPLDE